MASTVHDAVVAHVVDVGVRSPPSFCPLQRAGDCFVLRREGDERNVGELPSVHPGFHWQGSSIVDLKSARHSPTSVETEVLCSKLQSSGIFFGGIRGQRKKEHDENDGYKQFVGCMYSMEHHVIRTALPLLRPCICLSLVIYSLPSTKVIAKSRPCVD